MAPAGDPPLVDEETARVRSLYDAMAPRYDRVIAVAERVLFGDGRRWAAARPVVRSSKSPSAPAGTCPTTHPRLT